MDGGRILFVDDDVLNQWLMTEALMTVGFTVTGFSGGAEAARLLRAGYEFDLLLTDLVLSDGLSSFDLAAHWRRIFPDRPILFTSAAQQPTDIAVHGSEGFIAKHAAADELLVIVGLLLGSSFHPSTGRWKAKLTVD